MLQIYVPGDGTDQHSYTVDPDAVLHDAPYFTHMQEPQRDAARAAITRSMQIGNLMVRLQEIEERRAALLQAIDAMTAQSRACADATNRAVLVGADAETVAALHFDHFVALWKAQSRVLALQTPLSPVPQGAELIRSALRLWDSVVDKTHLVGEIGRGIQETVQRLRDTLTDEEIPLLQQLEGLGIDARVFASSRAKVEAEATSEDNAKDTGAPD